MTAQQARENALVAEAIYKDKELKAILSTIGVNISFGVFSVEMDKPRFWESTKNKLEELGYVVDVRGEKFKISW